MKNNEKTGKMVQYLQLPMSPSTKVTADDIRLKLCISNNTGDVAALTSEAMTVEKERLQGTEKVQLENCTTLEKEMAWQLR